jgi:biopolymer transport protein TolR
VAFGRLERTRGAAPMSDINMTPLIDVMLVLVVIFIITAPLLASSIKLDLPKSEAARPNESSRFVLLVIDRAGQTFMDDKRVSLADMAGALAQIAAAAPDTEVQLRADEAVAYGRVVEVMSVAQKAGLYRIGFVADARAPAAR